MDLETVLVNLVVGVGIGAVVFLLFVWAAVRRYERHIESDLVATMEKLAQDRLIALTVEIDNNQYFCYNALTKDFVCQGQNLEEIIERFRLRYPNKSAAIYDGDEIAVKTLKAQMKELSEDSHSIRPTS
jgi:hypothetical protein